MNVTVRATGAILGRASEQLVSNNIESYENTIPSMLSDRLRNPKFAGPVNPQTGIAPEWEPAMNNMTGFSCQLIPGMYMSGQEAQLIHNYTQTTGCGILQAGVQVRAGETFEVELWARAHHQPVTVSVELRRVGCAPTATSRGQMLVDLAHWHRRTCRISAPPGAGGAYFQISLPAESRIVIDQVHLRPVGETHVSQALLDAFDHFPCPVLRFPGGCVTCTYHWEHGIGPVHRRPVCDDPVFKYKLHYDFGTDEYLALCAARGMRPMITLNTTTATPEDAAAWAAYVRDWYVRRSLPAPAAYFLFGNENYGLHEIGHMTGAMYVAQLRAFVPAVRAAYPEARIGVLGEYEADAVRRELRTPWRATLIKEAADLFDMLVVTRYCGGGDDLPLDQAMANVAENVASKAADLQVQVQTIREAGLERTIGIVEWNYWTRASHNDHAGFYEPNDIRHCLYAAGYLNAFCRLGEILEVANFYSLVNTMGIIHVHDGQVTYSDMVTVLKLYADALPGEVLALEVDAPVLTDKARAVDANFIRNGSAVFGFLVNFSHAQSATVSLQGVGPIREALGHSANATHQPLKSFTPAITDTTVTLPPMSLVRLRLEAAR